MRLNAVSHSPRTAAYGRFKARFKPGLGILVFYDGTALTISDISDVGFKLESNGQFEADNVYHFDIVFHEASDVSGWRLRAECRWTSDNEAGFLFKHDRWGQAISSRIARQHVRGRMKVLNGIEL